MKLTNAETALLGLLSEKPMYPYQIEQEVKSRNMRFWTDLSMSSIYKLLTKLEREKIVERIDDVSAENRIRKIYRLSKKGGECLSNSAMDSCWRLLHQIMFRVGACPAYLRAPR